MEKGHEETKQEMQKHLENVQKYQEELKNSLEEKINSVEYRIAGKMKEEITRMEDLEKKLLDGGNENKSKSLPVSAFPEPVLASPVPITASNGWTEGAKACQLAASLRGETAEVLQTLPDIEQLKLNSLCNAFDLRFGQKYSKEYTRLQMKTRLLKTRESLQEYAFEVERLANLAFSDHPATVRERISLQYFVDGLRDREVQKALRMADVQDIKSALLYVLKLEAASRRDRQSILGARVILDARCESPWKSDIEKLRDEFQAFKAQRQNQEKRNFKCWGCGGTGHQRRNCPWSRKDENIVSSSKQVN
ncbi:uncharacterized protein TNCV_4916591 [Trichonephila clavipes]|nr:uncharacterized protein TNCV_4916591 [Trichonephila clavipes]